MNIMLNTYCNLKCPYCFANPTMKECEEKEISLENLYYALNFFKKSGIKEVRFIGGEPTIYSKIKEAVDLVIDMNCFDKILIFSNFTFSDDLCDFFIDRSKKIQIGFLPNINEFDLLINKHRVNIINNLTKLFEAIPILDTIGINVYRTGMDLTQWDEIIKMLKGKIKHLRYSIAVPNLHILKDNFDFYEYYSQFESVLWDLVKVCNDNNVYLVCDCSNIPPCCFSADLIKAIYINGKFGLGHDISCGYPVIDIKPDLTYTGCFGSNDSREKNSIKDFNEAYEIVEYLKSTKTNNKIARKECLQCPRYQATGVSCSCRSTHLIDKERV